MEQAQLALILVMHSDVNAKCVGLLELFQRHSGLHDDVTCMYDDVTCMHDDVTCMYDDVTCMHDDATCMYDDVRWSASAFPAPFWIT